MDSSKHTYTIDCYAGAPTQAETKSAEPFHFQHPGSEQSAYVPHNRSWFESTESDRLNQAHWQNADIGEQPVDAVLALRLPIMRARSNHERINNPTIEGLMLSHTLAVAGENGPLLDLWGDSDEDDDWCDQAEAVWESWCAHADAAGGLDLGGLIKQWNYSCWYNGEWIEQLVPETREFQIAGLPQLRLHGIEVQRLMTPYGSQTDPTITLGVKKNAHRRPTAYWLTDSYYLGSISSTGRWYPARDIIHGMDRVQSERGQTRGIPWAQSGLPLMADLRDYDAQVLDAARLTADGAVFAFTRHNEAEFADNVPRSVAWRRRQINHLAPGWELGSVHSNQPLPQYKDFRHERMNDLGKGKGVPGMVTRLDARDHNYSSARFDYQLLGESAKHVRATLYNPQLRRLVSLVLSEAILMGILPPSPRRFYQQFIWPALPEIDQKKSAEAETTYLRNGTKSYSEVCANGHGRRSRDVMRQRERDERRLAAAGLPSVLQATSGATGTATAADQSNDEEQ